MTKNKRKLSLALAIGLCLSLFGGLCSPVNVSAYDYNLPSLWQEYEDYFIIGTFGGWNSQHSMYHYRYSSFPNDLKLVGQIGSPDSGINTPSRNEYNRRVAEINADTSLSDADKARLIEEANRNVVLLANPNSIRMLDQIREYNKTVPERDQKKIRAHVLVWHGGQQPMYFFCNGFNYNGNKITADWASPETMLARLESYIQQMMERYAPYNDIIYSWDVVNEGLDDYTGQVRNMDDPLTQSGQWGNIFRRTDLDDPGKEDQRLYEESVYIRKAFEFARKYSDQYGADWTLYYNDFQDSNKPYEPKMSQTIKMLKPIYEAGNIDGYGMQGRLATAYPSIDLLRQQIELGLTVADEFSFTETDIRSDFKPNPDWDPTKPAEPTGDTLETNTYDVKNGPAIRRDGWGRMNQDGWTAQKASEMAMREDIQREQADYTADLMDLLIEYKDKFVVMQWDGSSDSNTFNRSKGAHLWGGVAGNPEKMSYFAFIGAPNRDKLKNALESGPTDDMAGKYPAQKWAAYQEARDVAEPLVTKRIYDMDGVNAVKEALTNLNNAIDTLDLGIKILKDYVESTDLNNGNKNALTVKLDQALNLLIKKGDKKDEAIDVMNGFVVQVNSLAGAGKLTEEETAKLIKTAEEIISNINKL
ncbi:endo-1,4-beta-xylanase [Sinanaerobacter chloroacetimidivorans]|uniref:Endo-1,4-beta-xylanase n=1 Tax=Sinanaerobacter chloroacetimidivorans TaxID=2818044 RepID=A0A8J7W5F6_9FIRM|nr:endo-1,4-beta-xylanase [Sinanaerobacter chloroacetimidivorans]MBR0599285.1 endo-1,4-beta-xylanase [Sinanaerobacter chloroacetimidivorans]